MDKVTNGGSLSLGVQVCEPGSKVPNVDWVRKSGDEQVKSAGSGSAQVPVSCEPHNEMKGCRQSQATISSPLGTEAKGWVEKKHSKSADHKAL